MTARLGKLIRLLASDKSGEVVAAASAITRALATAGLDIHRLADVAERGLSVPGQTTPPPRDDSTAGDWRAMRRFCADHDALMSAREREFIADIKRWRGQLTVKQQTWLDGDLSAIAGHVRGFAALAATGARRAPPQHWLRKEKHHGR